MKKEYSGLFFVRMDFGVEGSILAGSVVPEPIKIQKVEVEEYKDGFETEGGFKEIDFD